ncbi:hypothetical protein SAY87_025068 [Trapa incisa]|uniref:Uncharacterized protein n=1 Tax=Trapa incisa TaxID=236973 RepID=A0AAN7GFB0_9MYRT|nr:hypothetical protein SAY87_025068 [Trapa incisa]
MNSSLIDRSPYSTVVNAGAFGRPLCSTIGDLQLQWFLLPLVCSLKEMGKILPSMNKAIIYSTSSEQDYLLKTISKGGRKITVTCCKVLALKMIKLIC